ncbi:hypothetical protein [Xylella fastidiosa]|nr:hypothetical protein [Xylella fastidiosa]MDG5826138.1 hypothetical protein [Xylella fastidiosa subsp. pauca]WGZ34052.1 hypothetical protein O4445_10470 [Xylella fastidiosa subsp. pauca]
MSDIRRNLSDSNLGNRVIKKTNNRIHPGFNRILGFNPNGV